jgi:hypothetical protein
MRPETGSTVWDTVQFIADKLDLQSKLTSAAIQGSTVLLPAGAAKVAVRVIKTGDGLTKSRLFTKDDD